jgi:GNAT superfamily N-acetyltransferase
MQPDAKFRQLAAGDFEDVAALFAQLTGEPLALNDHHYLNLLGFQGTQIFGAEVDGKIVSMATLHVLPNLGGVRLAYGLVENVVTLQAHHKQGLGRGVMKAVVDAAWVAGAYKIMLLTGVEAGAHGFYEKCGFLGESKIGMQMRRVPARKIPILL